MILAGIIDIRAGLVEDAAQRHGFVVSERLQEGDWVALIVRRA
jgi:ribosomal protein L11 methylase PrmA